MSGRQPRRKTIATPSGPSSAPLERSDPREELTAEAPETGMEFYSSPDGAVTLPVRFDGETVWVTQAQMADLFGVDVRTVNEHLGNAFRAVDLEREATIREIRMVRREGDRDVPIFSTETGLRSTKRSPATC